MPFKTQIGLGLVMVVALLLVIWAPELFGENNEKETAAPTQYALYETKMTGEFTVITEPQEVNGLKFVAVRSDINYGEYCAVTTRTDIKKGAVVSVMVVNMTALNGPDGPIRIIK